MEPVQKQVTHIGPKTYVHFIKINIGINTIELFCTEWKNFFVWKKNNIIKFKSHDR